MRLALANLLYHFFYQMSIPKVPKELVSIPVDYVEKAVKWMTGKKGIKDIFEKSLDFFDDRWYIIRG